MSFRRPPDSERNIKSTLYFGNVDIQVDEILMYELFIQFAPIKSINMPKDRILKTHQGFGFAEFKTVADADYVLEILHGVRLYGKQLRLKRAELKSATSTTSSGANSAIDVGARLFINNLNPLIDSQFLKDTFSKFGTLIRPPEVSIDRETGESRGFGFVTYNDFSASDEAIEKMHGAVLMNSKLNVTYAFKENSAKQRHGDSVDRTLAENARLNNVLKRSKRTR